MSTAMMSAPSSASRIAWLRPWPRAAPVMKATLPSTRPVMAGTSLLVREAGVDRHGDAGDVAGIVGDQPEERVGDIDRLHHSDPQRVGPRVGQAGILRGGLLRRLVGHHPAGDAGRRAG